MLSACRQNFELPVGPTMIVPMGDYRLATAPCTLITRDLGSCVGITIYSPHLRAGGLVHVAMPDSGIGTHQPSAHADVAILAVVLQLESLGAVRTLLEVTIAGGGNMFGFEVTPDMDIGARNITCVRQALANEMLRIKGEDVIEDHPRTMILDLADGRVLLSTGGQVYRVM